MQVFTTYVAAVWAVLLELSPWLLVGTAIAAVLHVLLPPAFIRRAFRGRLAVLKAVAVGVPLPLCSCGVIPAGLSLKENGASSGASLGFLISTPQTGVDSVLVSASFLGWPFALYKVLSAVLLGWFGGVLADRIGPEESRGDVHDERPFVRRGWRDGVAHGVKILRTIWRWLVLGVLVSAGLSAFIPAGSLSATSPAAEFVAMILVLLVSVPLYVCATASVPIAAAMVAAGMPTGAALVFLIAGPATNLATLGAVFRAFGKRVLVVYVSTLVVGSVLLGWLFGSVASLPAIQVPLHDHSETSWVATSSAIALVVLLAWFAWQELRAAWRPKEHRASCHR